MIELDKKRKARSKRITKKSSCVKHIVCTADKIQFTCCKCAVCIEMNCAKDKAETVMWTTDQHMAYYNLLPMMVEHWSYVHELNGYLMDVVRFLSTGYKTGKQPLNPLAPEFMHQKTKKTTRKEVTNKDDTKINEWSTRGRMFR